MADRIRVLEKIVVGIDLSKASDPLADFAIAVAAKYGSQLVFTYVVDESIVDHVAAGFDPNKLIEALTREAEEKLKEYVEKASHRGVNARFVIVDTPTEPAVGLTEVAEREGASEILVTYKGHKLFKIIPIGSTAMSLVNRSPLPVLIVKISDLKGKLVIRPSEGVEAEGLLSKPLLAVDSHVTQDFIEYFATLAHRAGSALQGVYVVHIIEPDEDEVSSRRLVNNVVKKLESHGLHARVIVLESHKPHREILSIAKQLGVTLIAVGRTIKKKGIWEFVAGTTLTRLLAESHLPLLVYPLEAEE
ncbi:MAG: universal stress protein [Desulfurococcales archaeon]|nr:universal stress protein [Desulfurococcales archaeon]